MAHEITRNDSLVLRKQAAWHGLGTIIDNDITAVEACEGFGLDWEVEKWPLFARRPGSGDLVEVETHCANVRSISTPEGDVESILGIVGDSYKVCQNMELAEFMDALSQTGDVVIETAGSIRGGKRIWFLARSDSFELDGGDVSHSYLLASNAHDGTGAIRLDPTDIRAVCANTLRAVIGDVGQESLTPAAITCRHTGDLGSKLAEARSALLNFRQIKANHRRVCERLSEKKIDRRSALEFFAGQYAGEFSSESEAGISSKLVASREKKEDRAAGAFLRRYDDECAKFGGESAWLALNAWTGYCQHDLGSSGRNSDDRKERRVNSMLFGVGSRRTSFALADAVSTFLSV